MSKEEKFYMLINRAYPELRAITFHTDGRAIVSSGSKAKYPKKLYTAKLRQHNNWADTTITAIDKLLKDNGIESI